MKKYLIGFFILLFATYFISGELGAASVSRFSSTPSTMNVLKAGTMTFDSLSTVNVAAGAVLQYGGAESFLFNSTLVVKGKFSPKVTVTTDTTASTDTYTAAEMINGLLLRKPTGANASDTTATAANIVAAIPNAVSGSSFNFFIENTGDSTITVCAGTGVTVSGTATIEGGSTRLFLGVITTTDTTVSLYSLGTLVH